MNINRRTYAITFLVILGAFLLLIQGCGSKNSAAPDGSTITINPASISATNIYLYGDVIQDYSVVVKYSDGTPIPYAGVTVAGSFAVPVASSAGPNAAARYQFYALPGANANPSNVPENNGFVGETDKNGVYQFSIQIYSEVTLTGVLVPNAFTDTILVTSGTAQANTTLNITTQ